MSVALKPFIKLLSVIFTFWIIVLNSWAWKNYKLGFLDNSLKFQCRCKTRYIDRYNFSNQIIFHESNFKKTYKSISVSDIKNLEWTTFCRCKIHCFSSKSIREYVTFAISLTKSCIINEIACFSLFSPVLLCCHYHYASTTDKFPYSVFTSPFLSLN